VPRRARRAATKRRARTEILNRSVEINSFRASVGLRIDQPRDPDPEIEGKPWLELRGTTDEPIREVHDVVFSIYPEDKPVVGTMRPPGVGSIIQTRPSISVVVSFAHVDFDRVWVLALSGQLKHAHVIFTKPRYNSALVLNVSFSNEREE
jgi:hypothetical protein